MDNTPPQPPMSGPDLEPIRPIQPPPIDYLRLATLTGNSFALLKDLSKGYPQIPAAVRDFDEVSKFTAALYDNGQQAEKTIDLLMKSGNPDKDTFSSVKENFSDMARTMVEDNVVILFSDYDTSATIMINGGTDHLFQLKLVWLNGQWNIDLECIRFSLNDDVRGEIICELDVWNGGTKFHIYFKQPENPEELALWEGLTLSCLDESEEFRLLERRLHKDVIIDLETFKVLVTADLLTDFEAAYEYYDVYGRRIHQISVVEQGDNLYAQGTSMRFGLEYDNGLAGDLEPTFYQQITGYQGYIDPEDIDVSTLPEQMVEKTIFYKAKVIKSANPDTKGDVLETQVEGVQNSPVESLIADFHDGSIYELVINGVIFYRNQDIQDFIVYRSPKPGEFIILADKSYGVDDPISYRFKFALNSNGQIESIESVSTTFEFMGEDGLIPMQMSLN